jgi:hypothetical protein
MKLALPAIKRVTVQYSLTPDAAHGYRVALVAVHA